MRRVTIAVLALAVLSPLTLYAQEWSSAQKAVWAETQRQHVAFYAGDMETNYEFMHPDFVFWNSHNSVPGDLSSARELDRCFFEEFGGRWHSAISPL